VPFELHTLKQSPCSEPDIPQDAATSSKVITVLTTSMQASSQDSIVRSEHVQAFSCSDEPPIGNTVNESQTATPVHPCLTPGEKNSTPAQPFGVAYETMQQPSPAPNNITGNLTEGVSTTGQASTHECGEPCGRDGTGDLPSQGSSYVVTTSTLRLPKNCLARRNSRTTKRRYRQIIRARS
jgi:hypothetical protein